MHRHGYKGTKFHRERDQRNALIKGLAESLIIHESIERHYQKLRLWFLTLKNSLRKLRKVTCTIRRQVLASLQTVSSAHKLVDEIAPKLGGRNSGYFRIKRTTLRRGDNAELARVSFVDDLKQAPVAQAASIAAPKPTAKPATKATATKETN